MSFLFPWFPATVKSGGFTSEVIPSQLGGEVWSLPIYADGYWDPDGVDELIAAPTGVRDFSYGSTGASAVAVSLILASIFF